MTGAELGDFLKARRALVSPTGDGGPRRRVPGLRREEVAALALFLCRDEAGSITGTNLSMDGGWTAA